MRSAWRRGFSARRERRQYHARRAENSPPPRGSRRRFPGIGAGHAASGAAEGRGRRREGGPGQRAGEEGRHCGVLLRGVRHVEELRRRGPTSGRTTATPVNTDRAGQRGGGDDWSSRAAQQRGVRPAHGVTKLARGGSQPAATADGTAPSASSAETPAVPFSRQHRFKLSNSPSPDGN